MGGLITCTDWDLAFPDDEREANPASYNFFRAAQDWAAQRAGAGGGLSYDMPDSDNEDEDGEGDEDAEEVEGVENGGAGDREAMDQDE